MLTDSEGSEVVHGIPADDVPLTKQVHCQRQLGPQGSCDCWVLISHDGREVGLPGACGEHLVEHPLEGLDILMRDEADAVHFSGLVLVYTGEDAGVHVVPIKPGSSNAGC